MLAAFYRFQVFRIRIRMAFAIRWQTMINMIITIERYYCGSNHIEATADLSHNAEILRIVLFVERTLADAQIIQRNKLRRLFPSLLSAPLTHESFSIIHIMAYLSKVYDFRIIF